MPGLAKIRYGAANESMCQDLVRCANDYCGHLHSCWDKNSVAYGLLSSVPKSLKRKPPDVAGFSASGNRIATQLIPSDNDFLGSSSQRGTREKIL
jgi:hypothetical protein